MEGIMSLINEASAKVDEVTSIKQINQTTMQEFLNKIAIWDFFEMSRDEFTSKSDYDRELLIIRYYNSLQSGIFCYLFFFVWFLCFVNDKCVSSKIISYSFISVWLYNSLQLALSTFVRVDIEKYLLFLPTV